MCKVLWYHRHQLKIPKVVQDARQHLKRQILRVFHGSVVSSKEQSKDFVINH